MVDLANHWYIQPFDCIGMVDSQGKKIKTTPSGSRKSRLQVFGKPLLALGAVLVTFGLCEIAIRMVGLSPEVIPIGVSNKDNVHRRSSNPILSYELKPNYRNDAADGKFSFPYTNAHGMRDVEREVKKPDGVKRILILGDSVVVGHGIRDIDDLMSRQLEKLYPDGDVEVLNLAVAGYCTRAEVELLKEKGLQFEPDVVILVFVQNDFTNYQRETQKIEGIQNRPESVKFLFQASHLFRLACLKLNLFGFGLEADPVQWNQRVLGDNNVDEGLTLLRELAEKNQFEVLIAAWPLFTDETISYSEIMNMPDSSDELIIERLGRMHGLQTVRLADLFSEHWQNLSPRPNPKEYYTIGDTMHPSRVGHRVTAEFLKEVVDEQDLLREDEVLQSLQSAAEQSDELALQAARLQGKEKATYADLHFNQGLMLKQDGKLAEAAKEYAEAVRLAADDAEYRSNYGNVLRMLKRFKEARIQLEKAVKLDPTVYEAHFNLALTLIAMGEQKAGLERMKHVLDVKPDFTPAHLSLAGLYYELGDYDAAVEQYQQYLTMNPDDAMARSNLGGLLVAANRIDEAIIELEQALQSQSQSAVVRVNLAEAYLKAGRADDATIQAQLALQLAEDADARSLIPEIEKVLRQLNQKTSAEGATRN